jgi:hypothetical protein
MDHQTERTIPNRAARRDARYRPRQASLRERLLRSPSDGPAQVGEDRCVTVDGSWVGLQFPLPGERIDVAVETARYRAIAGNPTTPSARSWWAKKCADSRLAKIRAFTRLAQSRRSTTATCRSPRMPNQVRRSAVRARTTRRARVGCTKSSQDPGSPGDGDLPGRAARADRGSTTPTGNWRWS